MWYCRYKDKQNTDIHMEHVIPDVTVLLSCSWPRGIIKMFKISARMHTHTKKRNIEITRNLSCSAFLPSNKPAFIYVLTGQHFLRYKVVTGTVAWGSAGGCENQSVGFHLAGLDYKRRSMEAPEQRALTAAADTTEQTFCPELQTARPAGESHSGGEAWRIGSSAGPSAPLAWTFTRLKQRSILLIIV